jgi:hypothetical protein
MGGATFRALVQVRLGNLLAFVAFPQDYLVSVLLPQIERAGLVPGLSVLAVQVSAHAEYAKPAGSQLWVCCQTQKSLVLA